MCFMILVSAFFFVGLLAITLSVSSVIASGFFLKILFIYFREGKGGWKRGRETSMCGCLFHAPNQGPGLQPRPVPWLGIQLVTFRFSGWHSVQLYNQKLYVDFQLWRTSVPLTPALLKGQLCVCLCINKNINSKIYNKNN